MQRRQWIILQTLHEYSYLVIEVDRLYFGLCFSNFFETYRTVIVLTKSFGFRRDIKINNSEGPGPWCALQPFLSLIQTKRIVTPATNSVVATTACLHLNMINKRKAKLKSKRQPKWLCNKIWKKIIFFYLYCNVVDTSELLYSRDTVSDSLNHRYVFT